MGYCVQPFSKKDKTTARYMDLPCGKCHECLATRVNGWTFRLDQEMKRAVSARFVSLTYDNYNVVSTNNGDFTLFKPDLQAYFKRLRQYEKRKNNNPHKLSYYAVGEYGEITKRPHYHIILFNASDMGIEACWKNSKGFAIGGVHLGKVETGSIRYTLNYVCKGRIIPEFDGDERSKEFSLMSQGLGRSYITENMMRWHHSDPLNRYYIPLEDGLKTAMPRYFKTKIYTDYEREQITAHLQNVLADEIAQALEKNGPEPGHVAQERINVKARKFKLKRKQLQEL